MKRIFGVWFLVLMLFYGCVSDLGQTSAERGPEAPQEFQREALERDDEGMAELETKPLSPVYAQHSVASAFGDHRGVSVYFEAGKDGGVSGDVRLYDRMIALVVGIDRYSDLSADGQLQYAVRDAKGVADVLRER